MLNSVRKKMIRRAVRIKSKPKRVGREAEKMGEIYSWMSSGRLILLQER